MSLPRYNFVSSYIGRLEDTCSTAAPATIPLVSYDLVLLEVIEIDEHLKDIETGSMHGKKYVSANKGNPGKDTTHTWETDEQYRANFIGRMGDWLLEMCKRKFGFSLRHESLVDL